MKSRYKKSIIGLMTCVFVLTSVYLSLAQTPSGSSEKYVTFNFTDGVDIRKLIELISVMMNKNFVVDDKVRGKVIIISPKQISLDEAYKVFESVLEVHGFAAVEAGEITKIIIAKDAYRRNIETKLEAMRESPEDNIVTQVIRLKYADPNEIGGKILRQFSSGIVVPYTPTNTLILTDVYSNIQRLLTIIEALDVEGVGQEISVISVEYGDAKKLVTILTTIFQQKGRVRGKPATVTDIARFVADERTNSIVAIASEDDTARVRELVARLDKKIPRGTEKIHVYYLENATAEELAKVLQSLSTKQKQTTTKEGKKEAPIVSEATNITADKATNSLIIMADKDEYNVLEEIIKKLDIRRPMVYIECLIMEVNVSREFTIGTEWISAGKTSRNGHDGAFGGGFSGGDNSTSYGNLGTMTTSQKFPGGLSLGIFSELLKIGDGTSTILFPNIAALVQAYKRDKDVNILSTPQILTTDNEEATIHIGKNVPYLTKTGSTTVESYETYEYKDVGIRLKITPQISKDRMIRLKIEQEVNKLESATTSTGDAAPTTLKRTITTTIVVNDKNTVVIGGLIDNSFSETEYRTPCIGDIPIIGWLFRSMAEGNEKSNLFVFLTPHVIESSEEAETIRQDKEGFINNLEQNDGIKMYKPME